MFTEHVGAFLDVQKLQLDVHGQRGTGTVQSRGQRAGAAVAWGTGDKTQSGVLLVEWMGHSGELGTSEG